MKFTAWEARRRIESSYKSALFRLGRFLADAVGDEDNLEEILSKFSQVSSSKPFLSWAQALAHTFVTHTLEENAKTWRQAAAMSGQGGAIRQALKEEMTGSVGRRVDELIKENAKYIKTVPQDVSLDLVRHVQSQAYQGSRGAQNTPEFRAMVGEMSRNHARLISRTESAKAMSALTQARAESTGHDWYIWHATHDIRTRPSHKKMDGVLCRFSDPPAPEELIGEKGAGSYGPGNIYNCRCYAEPIILWHEVVWPHKVYANGSVRMMGKKQFEDEFGVAA